MSVKKKPSVFKRVWNALFKPARPVYLEDKASGKTKRRAKSQATQARAAHKPAKRAAEVETTALTPDQPAYWGYMDGKGNVRLKGSDRVLGKSNRSKKAALQDFAERFADQEARVAVLESLGQSAALEPAHWQSLERLALEIKQQPGLGDLSALEARLADLEARFANAARELHDQRQAMLDELAVLAQLGKAQDVSGELADLEGRWSTLVVTGAVDEAPQLLRFERSVKAIRQLQSQVDHNKDALRAEGDQLAENLEILIEDSAWIEAEALLTKRGERRALIERALGEEMRKRFTDLEAVIAANAAEQRQVQAADKAAQDEARQTVLDRFKAYLEQGDWRDAPEVARAIKQDWQALQADASLHNPSQDLIFAQLRAALQDGLRDQQSARAELRQEASNTRQSMLERLETLAAEAKSAPAAQGWSVFDDGIKDVRTAWAKLKPAASATEEQALCAAMDRLGDLRQAHFERQAAGRDQALEKKRILIDDVAKFSPALGSKELRQHLADSLDAWKAAGSAGRDHDEGLWQSYNAARDLVRLEIDRLRQIEAGEAAERLAAAFAAKKERQAQIENLIMVDELLQESKPSKSLEKQIEKKRAQVRELQDQMMDIQRRLREMAKRKKNETEAGDQQQLKSNNLSENSGSQPAESESQV